MSYFKKQYKLGVLGGGQLGRMLIQSAIDLNVYVKVLDPDANAPCSLIANEFVNGSLTDYDSVLDFGQGLDVLTIEIENVNTDALMTLRKRGVKVFPQPEVIQLIQDKRTQKQFYQDHQIPTAEFLLIENKEDVKKHLDFLPAVQKTARDGYDGRGVQKLNGTSDLTQAFDVPGLLEKLIDIEKEISVIIARNEKGEVSLFPPVELVYHEANLVDYLLGPADVSEEVVQKANDIATQIITKLDMVGILAVELFVTKTGEVLVNEVAPRPHNSGHQTIEANYTSQYSQHLRSVLGLPLGSTHLRSQSAMVNLLGEDGHTGEVYYEGLHEALNIEGVFVHLYGKKITKPFRKMGHVTIIGDDKESLIQKVNEVKATLKSVTIAEK